MTPRRFAYVMEFDRRGSVWAGTAAQRQTVRDAFADHLSADPRPAGLRFVAPRHGGPLVFGEPFDLTMRALAKKVKLTSPYVRIMFETGIAFGVSWPSIIMLNRAVEDPDVLASVVMHELGHVVGWNLFNPTDRSEGWAEDFKRWVFSNSPIDHPVWKRIAPLVAT